MEQRLYFNFIYNPHDEKGTARQILFPSNLGFYLLVVRCIYDIFALSQTHINTPTPTNTWVHIIYVHVLLYTWPFHLRNLSRTTLHRRYVSCISSLYRLFAQWDGALLALRWRRCENRFPVASNLLCLGMQTACCFAENIHFSTFREKNALSKSHHVTCYTNMIFL